MAIKPLLGSNETSNQRNARIDNVKGNILPFATDSEIFVYLMLRKTVEASMLLQSMYKFKMLNLPHSFSRGDYNLKNLTSYLCDLF